MASEVLRKKLPPNMRSDFWNDFIDAIESESEIAKVSMSEKENLFNMETMDSTRMTELLTLLGFPCDVSINSSDDFLRMEVESIPFKIKYKATTLLYLSLFKALSRSGMIYLYYYDSENLIRDTYGLLAYTNGIDTSEPYYQRSKMNFSEVISSDYMLDSGLKLDEGWKLDNSTSKLNTKHLALEFFIDQVVTVDNTDFLMIPEYFSYISTNMDKFKKVSEVIHVGCQLGAITDSSGYYNSLGYTYTMPTLKLNCVTTDNWTSITDVDSITYMIFGIGSNSNLPAINGTGTIPTALVSKVAKIKILNSEKYEDNTYYGVNAEYIGNLINDETLGTGDGSTTSFSSTLNYYPVKPYNVKLSFTSASTEYTLEDDGYGTLLGTNATGIINYDTGAVTVNMEFYYEVSETLGTGDGSTTSFSYTTTYSSIKENSILIKYIISGTTYTASDNGSGTIVGTSVTGTINYTTGEVTLTFTLAPANSTNIVITYSYNKTTIPDNGTTIDVEYYFLKNSIEITEAGITDSGGKLLAYATFPPLKFKNYTNHLNMFFMIDKSSWSVIDYDGGTASTTTVVSTIDGGDSSTTEFSNYINGGTSD
jgi:hypothetical protein